MPVDTLGSILEITPELREGTALFPDVSGFRAARLFRPGDGAEDGPLVLEVTWSDGGRLVRERTELTTAGVDAFRREVTAALAAAEPTRAVTREGRGGLVWGATGLGLGFYGWAVPVALDVDGDRLAVATYLLTAASSFYLPYRFTRDRTVTDAHRNFALWGATRGALYGGILGFGLTDRGGIPDPAEDDLDDWRVRLGIAAASSVTGGVLGFRAVDRTGMDEGAADVRGMLTDFATAAGFGTAYVAGLFDEEITTGRDGFPVREEADLLPGSLVALAFTGGGLWAAGVVGERSAYTVGNVHALRSFGLLGAQVLLPAANLIDRDSGKLHAAAAMVGAGSGLWMGNRTIRGEVLSGGDGLLVAAGHLAGGLLGAGLTYLVAPEDGDREALLYLTTSAVGSAAGFAFTYRALSSRGEPSGSAARPSGSGAPRSALRRDARGAPGGGVEVLTNPAGLLPLLAGGRLGDAERKDGAVVRLPLLTVTW